MKNKTFNYWGILLLLLIFCNNVKAQGITIHTIGDSTMATYDENSTDKRGWGQMFHQFFANGVSVNNRAKSGASSKSFYNEAPYWTTVVKQIKAGDYVFIQFSHNDEKNNGLDGDEITPKPEDTRGTSPWGTYQNYLRKYINETRALDATPVLVTPIVRRYFEKDTISRKGQHDLSPANDNSLNYVAAMKAVAKEMNVSLIDHTQLTKELVISYGSTASGSLLYVSDDNTHTCALGATLFARLVAQDMVKQEILAEYVNADADVIINPYGYDFGKMYMNSTRTQAFTILGMGLSPVEGKFTLSASDGFSVSQTADGVFSDFIEIPYTNGNLDVTPFYVRCTPASAGTVTGKLTVAYGDTTKEIELSGECVNLEGGVSASVYWELSENEEYSISGPVQAIPQSWSNMEVQRYAKPNATTTWENPNINGETKTQRNLITGGAWPGGEIDIVSDRYIQFGITAIKGTTLNIDSIGLNVGGAGGNGMRYRVYGSNDLNDFNDTRMLEERLTNTSNTMYSISLSPIVEVKEGESYYLRIYPWYNGAATGKTICLHGIAIRGIVTENQSSGIGASEKEINLTCTPSAVTSTATLKYALKSSYEVNLNIVGINGQEVINLNYGRRDAGEYEVPVDFSGLASGVYFCTLLTDADKQVVKVIKK